MKINIMKTACLAAGLSLGLVLIAKVCFIEEYNSFIPDKERIVTMMEHATFQKNPGDPIETQYIPGGVMPTLAAEMPEVESATRITMLVGRQGEKTVTHDMEFNAQIYCADSCFFDVFGLPVLAGNPKEILAQPGHTMVSRSVAERFGGVDKALGKSFWIANDKDTKYVIDGVFEDLPENCTLDFDALASIEWLDKSHLDNWLGDEQYLGFAKLREGVTVADAKPTLDRVCNAHTDSLLTAEAGVEIRFEMLTLDDMLRNDKPMQNLKLLMLFMGVSLIVIAALNYLVIVVSSLVGRTKEIAVGKCYGALFEDILKATFRESLVHLAASLALGAAMVLMIRGKAEELLAASLPALFTAKTVALLVVICMALLAVTSIVPSLVFDRVPVAAAFRSMKDSRRTWKLGLLAVQFVATAVIVCLLAVITLQFDKVANAERGYCFERLLDIRTYGVSDDIRDRLVAEIRSMPGVESATSCCQMPHYGYSPNCVFLPGEGEQLFNLCDMYCITDDYFSTMGIPVIEGSQFSPGEKGGRNVMVSRRFAEKLNATTGQSGSVVGRQVVFPGHSQHNMDAFTIIGVFEDVRIGSGKSLEVYPLAMFTVDNESWARPYNIVVKPHAVTQESVARINAVIADMVPDRSLEAVPVETFMLQQLDNERNIRDALAICSVVAMVIALAGLLGYTADEVSRRRKEMAVRKVLGASNLSVYANLLRDITLIAMPSLTVGAMLSAWLASVWLQNYNDRIDLSVWLFAAIVLAIYSFIAACVLVRSHRAVNENPVNALYMTE